MSEKNQEELEKLWNELLGLDPNPDDFVEVIVEVVKLRHKAWQELKKKKPSKEALLRLIDIQEPVIQIESATALLEKELGPEELRRIIETVKNDNIELRACSVLLERFPTADNICFILNNSTIVDLKQKAIDLLQKLYPEIAEEKASRRQEGLRKAVIKKIKELG